MAILRAFAILDSKADAFMTPFFFHSTGQAVRAFKDLANDGQSMVHRHPDDYRLFCIGSFDDSVALLSSLERPEPLGFASDYRDMGSGVPVGVLPLKGAHP